MQKVSARRWEHTDCSITSKHTVVSVVASLVSHRTARITDRVRSLRRAELRELRRLETLDLHALLTRPLVLQRLALLAVASGTVAARAADLGHAEEALMQRLRGTLVRHGTVLVGRQVGERQRRGGVVVLDRYGDGLAGQRVAAVVLFKHTGEVRGRTGHFDSGGEVDALVGGAHVRRRFVEERSQLRLVFRTVRRYWVVR